jgi:hypothetical protein
MRAVWSGSTAQLLHLGQSWIILPRYLAGMLSVIVAGSVGSAVSAPRKSLMEAAMRFAVVKSGLRSASAASAASSA